MHPSEIPVDALGFPLPRTFDAGGAAESPPRHSRAVFTLRYMLVGVAVAAAIMALLRSEIGAPAGRAVAAWLTRHALQKFYADDLQGALNDLNRAAAWNDRAPDIFALRGEVRLERGDVQGALADFNKLVALAPNDSGAYVLRATALQRLEQHDAAIRDATQAVRVHNYPSSHLLNTRAYMRAIAGQELDEALVDVDQALKLDGENPLYLDTRGYILLLTGRYDEALADLDLAIELENGRSRNPLLIAGGARGGLPARLRRQHEEGMAVMYHHRGEIYEKLGNAARASADLSRGEALGYNPARGVY